MSHGIEGIVFLVAAVGVFASATHFVEQRAKYFGSGIWMAGGTLLTLWLIATIEAVVGVVLLASAAGASFETATALNRWLTAGLGVAILLTSRRLSAIAIERYPDSTPGFTRAAPVVLGLGLLLVAWVLGGVAPVYP